MNKFYYDVDFMFLDGPLCFHNVSTTRPSFNIEENEKEDGTIEILSQKWEHLEIKNMNPTEEQGPKLYQWLKGYVDGKCDVCNVRIKLFNESNSLVESWLLKNAWPKSIEVGSIDDDADINLTLVLNDVVYETG